MFSRRPERAVRSMAAASSAAPAPMDAAEPGPGTLEEHRRKSWEFFRSLGSPELHVAPMVDQARHSCCGCTPAGQAEAEALCKRERVPYKAFQKGFHLYAPGQGGDSGAAGRLPAGRGGAGKAWLINVVGWGTT